MIVQALAFYLFAGILTLSALMVITARNPVHSVLFLILAFFNAAGLFVMLGAEFVGLILVIVYVGAVAVLFLFVVMMLDIDIAKMREGFANYWPLGAIIAGIVIAEIASVVWVKSLGLDSLEPAAAATTESNTRALGELLYTEYLYPFELAAVLLLVAIVAAIVLTMRHRTGHKAQDVTAQVSVRAQDRIRIVKMPAEKKEGEGAA